MKTNFAFWARPWLLALLLATSVAARAQSVGIGTTTPAASAALEVRAANKGVLFPRVSLAGLADAGTVPAPAPALLVFNTNAALPGGVGFYYNAGTATAPAWTRLNTGSAPAGTGWGLSGNAATDSTLNYLGTTDNKPLRLGIGGREQARLHVNGAFWLGGVPFGPSLSFPDNQLLLGYQAGKQLPAGSYNNQFVGYQAGLKTTGNNNQFTGFQAGLNNTSGTNNQFTGLRAGYRNTTGRDNVFSGYESGFNNTTGNFNLFSGLRAGRANTTGSNNQLDGYQSGSYNTTGSNNQFSGYQSGLFNTTGNYNYFSGYQSGYYNETASYNHFSGYQAGYSNTTGNFNQFDGYQSGYNNRGSYNQFSGYQAGFYSLGGAQNYFSGNESGFNTSTGGANTFVGYTSGYYNTTGGANTALGDQAGPATGGLENTTALGYGAKAGVSNALVLGGAGTAAVNVGIGTPAPAARLHVYGAGPALLRLQSSDAFGTAGLDFWSDPQGSQSEWRPAFVRSADAGNFTGQLAFYTNGTGYNNRQGGVEQMRLVNGGLAIGGTAVGGYRLYVTGAAGATGGFFNTSDQRLKTHVRPLSGALALVQALRGVRYEWNALGVARGGAAGREQVGLLAQELARVLPELVSTGPDGYQAVNYAQLTPVLIEAVKELTADNDALRQQLRQLQQQQRQDRAAAAAQASGFAQRLRALEAAGAQAAAGSR